MRSSLLLSSSVLALCTVVTTALAACSSTPTVRAFDEGDDAGATTQTPEQNAAPAPTGSGPVGTGSEAGAGDAAGNCATTPPSNMCGIKDQCGCTLAQTCDVTDNAGNVSCVTAGLAVMGAPCVNTSGCARGLTCVGETCRAFCDNPGGTCAIAKTGGCFQITDSNDKAIPNLSVCAIACDLRDAAACGGVTAAGSGSCQMDGKGGTDCGPAGTATAGQTCSPTIDCAPALVCVNTTVGSTVTSTCKKWCKVGSTDCGGSTACNGFSTKAMVGSTEFGVCP